MLSSTTADLIEDLTQRRRHAQRGRLTLLFFLTTIIGSRYAGSLLREGWLGYRCSVLLDGIFLHFWRLLSEDFILVKVKPHYLFVLDPFTR